VAKKILNTSILINHWGDCGGNSPAGHSANEAAQWAARLVELRGIDAIVTPVYLEFVVGMLTAHQLELARAYLARFRIIDGGQVLPEDWVEARRIGERVPRKPRRRQMGDCLIQAIANRLRHDVDTADRRFAW